MLKTSKLRHAVKNILKNAIFLINKKLKPLMATGLVVVFGGHIEGHIALEKVRYFTVNYDFRKIDFRYEKKPETLVKSRFFGLFFGRGRRARLSPDGSVGASASQRSPQEIHTPRRATRASGSRLCCFSEKRKDTAYAMSFWQGQKGSNPRHAVLEDSILSLFDAV